MTVVMTMDINRDLLTESINKLMKQNILNEAEGDEDNQDQNSLDDTESTSSEEENSEETEEDNSNDDSNDDSTEDQEENEDELDNDPEQPDSEETDIDNSEETPEETPEEPKESNSDKFLKLQIFNKLVELKDVMDKFNYIINDRNMENFSDSERNDMFDITELTTKSLDQLKDNINLFNNKFINIVDVDKSEKLYKKFENTYKEIFDNYLKEYNKLESTKKRNKK